MTLPSKDSFPMIGAVWSTSLTRLNASKTSLILLAPRVISLSERDVNERSQAD